MIYLRKLYLTNLRKKNKKLLKFDLNFSTIANSNKLSKNSELHPFYISGLTQSDGSFFIQINKRISKKTGKVYLRFVPKFIITTDEGSIEVLFKIKNFFGCGTVTKIKKDNSASFIVTNLDDLNNIIIPHFNNYPVYFNKLHSFNLFVKICNLLATSDNLRLPLEKEPNNKEFQDFERMQKELFLLSISINANSTTRSIEKITDYLKILNIQIPDPFNSIFDLPGIILNNIVELNSPLTPEFIAGMLDGDSSYYIIFTSKGEIIPAVKLCFGLTCLDLLHETEKFIGPGYLDFNDRKTIYLLVIKNLETIINKVIPFTDSIKLHTKKAEHYEIWKKVCIKIYDNLKNNKNLDLKTKIEIVEMSYNMNKDGKRRKYKKEEYIKILENQFSN